MTVKSQSASHDILVLFNSTPSQAAKFEGEAAEKARAVAEGLGHRCVTLNPAKDAKLIASLARGAFDKEGAPLLGAVTPRMISELAAVRRLGVEQMQDPRRLNGRDLGHAGIEHHGKADLPHGSPLALRLADEAFGCGIEEMRIGGIADNPAEAPRMVPRRIEVIHQ
ncbi:hypothetical protein [Roseixanthobacter liquoris]|uniref:hypothetical protein n=1 Tax=Roseixanthobacter liquoris TaxID=3119921 RepID=UPI003726771E